MAKNIEMETPQFNKIENGTSIVGDIKSSGDIRIDGTIKGNLNIKGRVIIGAAGQITGEVYCKNADIEGKIEGKINVGELLTLKASSLIQGDIVTKKIAIEPGAKFTGNCNMTDAAASNQSAPEEKSK